MGQDVAGMLIFGECTVLNSGLVEMPIAFPERHLLFSPDFEEIITREISECGTYEMEVHE